MTGLRIGYALLLLLVLGLDTFCGSILSAAVTALLVLTPLLCIPLHLYAAKKLRVRLDAPVNLEKGEEGTLRICAENGSVVPLCLLGVRMRLTNLLTGQTVVRHYRLTASPRRETVSEYKISSAHCGRIQLTTERCCLYDPFGLIGIRLGEPSVAAMTVQPKGFVQSVYVSPDANCPDDSDSYSQERSGYDLSEVYALRDYYPGDSLRQIHWKLSGKLDRLVVREPSLPVRWSVLVFWERTQHASPEETDAQADVVMTVCRSILEAGVQFAICWNDAQEQQCVSQPVRSIDELTGLLPRLLSAGEAQGESGAAMFYRSCGEAVLSHILYITGRVPKEAFALGDFGRLTVLSCAEEADGVLRFDPEHYAEQLSELEI